MTLLFSCLVDPLVTFVGEENCVLQEMKYSSDVVPHWLRRCGLRVSGWFRLCLLSFCGVESLKLNVWKPVMWACSLADLMENIYLSSMLIWPSLPRRKFPGIPAYPSFGLGKSWMGLKSYFLLSSVLHLCIKKTRENTNFFFSFHPAFPCSLGAKLTFEDRRWLWDGANSRGGSFFMPSVSPPKVEHMVNVAANIRNNC